MRQPGEADVTGLLKALRSSRGESAPVRDRLYAALYSQLQRAAAGLMRRERAGHTLEPDAVVHEAFLRLVDQAGVDWVDRAHFLGVATRAMRQVLVDHARRRNAAKRGKSWQRVTLTHGIAGQPDPGLEILQVEDLLSRLAQLSDRMARVAELRIFGGMTHPEIAEALSISERTAKGDWAVARRWLARELARESKE